MCISSLPLNTKVNSLFILPCTALVLLSTTHCPSFTLHCLSRGIACLPGGVAEELVRLSSQGFHLVIGPLSIHTTLLPPEAACLHTDLLKETSHCHFNFHSTARFSAPISSLSLHPFCFSFCLFLANSLLCGLSSSLSCVSAIFCLFFCLPGFFDECVHF